MTLRQVIDAHDGALPKGTLCIIGANVLVFLKVRRSGLSIAHREITFFRLYS
jgi:hypothetical protein